MTAIHVESLSQEIAKRIREMIRKGVLRKGDRIVEKPLCHAMGVSRTPLREALRLLCSEGLIELIPNKGAIVAQPAMRDVREMFQVMSILEGTCARECAKKMNEKSLKKLEQLFQKLEKHFQDKNHEKYMAVNHSYHTLVQELAGNKILSEVINGLRQKILLYRYRQIYEPNRLDSSMQEHRDLQDAFKKKDPEAAERLMKEHLMRQCEVLESADPETLASSRPKRSRTRDSG
ncbi:MAG: GntR family transcriptional regulator [Desulfomonile tiedjei]|uniref:GntR family transcriptional regulator n=1 Tax=Desulfomonile tiedjei TaxID=2358 RepID=A0A9D6V4H7_9BACT|nr:GntR family transcriptional regulator [Desulfomonile tiedjei]